MLELETKQLSKEATHYLDNTNAQLISFSNSTNQLDYQKLFPNKQGEYSKKCLKLPRIRKPSCINNNSPDKIKISKNSGIVAIQYGQILNFFNYNKSGDHLEVPGYTFEIKQNSNLPSEGVLLDFFWTGKSTILLVFTNCLRTLLINDKQSITCYGGFRFEESIDFAICWSEDSNPSTRLQKDWIRNEIGKNLFNTVAVGTSDAKLILFRCHETTIHQLQTIIVDKNRCAEKRGRRRSISQDSHSLNKTVGSWVMDVVNMPGRILSSSYNNPENKNTTETKQVESSRSRSVSINENDNDFLDRLSLASGISHRSCTTNSSSKSQYSDSTKNQPKKLLRSSTNLMFVYDQLFVSILCKSRHFYQLHLYRILGKNEPQTLAHVLRLKRSGRFFVQIVDHLILMHHLEEKETLVFDIAYLVKRHRAISGSAGTGFNSENIQSDAKFSYSKYKSCGFTHAMPYYHDPIAVVSIPSYSKSWRSCCNQIIHSRKNNELITIKLNLGKIVKPLQSQLQMNSKDIIRFLQRRIECSILDAKNAIIDYTHSLIPENIPFDVILEDLRKEKPVEQNKTTTQQTSTKSIPIFNSNSNKNPNAALNIKKVMLKSTQDHSRKFHFLTQREILTKIIEKQYSIISFTTVLSLIKCLKLYQHKPILPDFYLILVKKLISNNQVPLLKQLLLQRIIVDDDSIGCFLLKNGHTELGLDIFRRLGADHVEQAIEVLMLTKQVERCIKYAVKNKREDCLSPARLMEIVKDDKLRFISIYDYCLKRNNRLRGSCEFFAKDRCDDYISLYEKYIESA